MFRQKIRFASATVFLPRETKIHFELNPSRATESIDEVGMRRAQASDHSTRRVDAYAILDGQELRVQRQQASEEERPQQAPAGVHVGLPIDEYAALPQARAGGLVVPADLSEQARVGVSEGSFDRGQARFEKFGRRALPQQARCGRASRFHQRRPNSSRRSSCPNGLARYAIAPWRIACATRASHRSGASMITGRSESSWRIFLSASSPLES